MRHEQDLLQGNHLFVVLTVYRGEKTVAKVGIEVLVAGHLIYFFPFLLAHLVLDRLDRVIL